MERQAHKHFQCQIFGAWVGVSMGSCLYLSLLVTFSLAVGVVWPLQPACI